MKIKGLNSVHVNYQKNLSKIKSLTEVIKHYTAISLFNVGQAG